MSFEVKSPDADEMHRGFDPDKRVDVSNLSGTNNSASEPFDPNHRIEISNESKTQDIDIRAYDPDKRANTVDIDILSEQNDSTVLKDGDKVTISDIKTYNVIQNREKPFHSADPSKWFETGGKISIEQKESGQIWTFTDENGREVVYIDGYPKFPPESKHPFIDDISIEAFTGDRSDDKKIYLEKLEEQYGLTEIPEGYILHHDSVNGNLQLIKKDWHEGFPHQGGHALHKEGE